jgi:hypothetical protein
MPLTSQLFRGDPALEACLVLDSKHITQGASGEHVAKIQTALKQLDNASIDAADLSTKRYGTSTAAAVLAYKTRRGIVNRAYQTQPDNIVGKMTLASLDAELNGTEADLRLVTGANSRRLLALMQAEGELVRLKNDFEPNAPDPSDPVVQALGRQLFLVLDSNFWTVVNQVLDMIRKNRQTQSALLIDKTDSNFAHVDPSNDPTRGVTVGASFFNTNDNCRQEVITHEFFHFIVGLQHFYSTSTTSEALRCPHHLARVVFDIAVGQQLAPCAVNGSVCR